MNLNFDVKSFVLIICLSIKSVENIFIDTNFGKFLNESCHTHSNILLHSKFNYESLVEKYYSKSHCLNHIQDLNHLNQEFSDEIIELDEPDVNLIVELNTENDLQAIYGVIDSRFSMNVNFILIVKIGSLKDIDLKVFHKFDGFRCHVVRYDNGFSDVKVSYIRPVINGCHSYNGILYSTEDNLKEMLSSTACNLNGTYLRVAVNIDLPYCNLQYEDGAFIMKESVELKMIEVLAERFNFKIEIIYSNQSWGSLVNGVWTGSVGHLYNKTADIAICDLTRSNERLKVVDFTKAYITVPLTFITTKPGLKSRTWITIEPFASEVWLSMFASFLMTTVFIQLLYSTVVSTDKPIDSISISLFAALLQQSDIRIPSKNLSIQFFFGLWLLSSLILMKTYSGIFFSVLTIPVYENPIETLDDLERAAVTGDYHIVTPPNTFYYDLFVKAQCCGPYHVIGNAIKGSDVPLPKSIQLGIELINRGASEQTNIIFIYSRDSLFFGLRSYATVNMYISSETLMMDQMAMALQKGSPLLSSMNQAVEQFIENGLFDNWLTDTLRAIPPKSYFDEPDRRDLIRNLRLNDLQSIFYISIFGQLFSILALICETIHSLRRHGFQSISL